MPKKTENVTKKIVKNKLLLLEELEKMPVIEVACKRVGVGRSTFYRWKQEDSVFDRQADVALDKGIALINDAMESKLISLGLEGSIHAIKFWLINRHEGYKPAHIAIAERRLEMAEEKQEKEDDPFARVNFSSFRR